MKLVGFIKDGKGTLHEPEELFAATGTIEIVKSLEGGIGVIEVNLGAAKAPKSKKTYKKREPKPEPEQA